MKIPVRQYGRFLGKYLRTQRPAVLLLALVVFTNIGLQLWNPLILRDFIDTATNRAPLEGLVGMGVLFVSIALASQALSVLATYVGESVGWNATNRLRVDLALHCLKLDMPFHKTHTPGEMIERIDGDVSAMSNFFSTFVIKVLGNILLMLGVIVVLFFQDWRVGVALGLFVALMLFAMWRMNGFAVAPHRDEREAAAGLFGFIEERLSGLNDIRANGAGGHVMQGLYGTMRTLYKSGRRAWRADGTMWSTFVGLFTLGHIAAGGVGAWLFLSGSISFGTVFLIFHYTIMLDQPLGEITDQLKDLQKAGAGLVRVQELLAMPVEIVDGRGAEFPRGALAVSFDDVKFGYGEEEMVMHGLTMDLKPGTVLGLLGRTGSGKTTLARLLLRLYDPAQGSITLSGADIRKARLHELRHAVGFVTQDVQLFNATLRENLTMFDANIPDEKIMQVVHELGLTEWYNALPEGLDTVLGPGGGSLSAGEAQLLAFARIFLRDPGVVVLDEASSRLDPATERLIERAVDKLLQNRTGIIIAHRLATVQRADEIMVLEDGRVLEHGPRLELANNPRSHFSQLLRTGLEEVLA
jgi:ABC-type multidrug transport system fused ATPase/permease subunit